MLRNRVPRRGRRAKTATPIDVLRGGVVVETWVPFEQYRDGAIEFRDYALDVTGGPSLTKSLDRGGDDREALRAHWMLRAAVRRDLQVRNGPAPLSTWMRRRRKCR